MLKRQSHGFNGSTHKCSQSMLDFSVSSLCVVGTAGHITTHAACVPSLLSTASTGERLGQASLENSERESEHKKHRCARERGEVPGAFFGDSPPGGPQQQESKQESD